MVTSNQTVIHVLATYNTDSKQSTKVVSSIFVTNIKEEPKRLSLIRECEITSVH